MPDFRRTLTAKKATVELRSGRRIQALTYEGRVPGPELVVRQGDLVEVTLVNQDISEGVAIHWHGVDLPNREDGVPGVTQDAVRPGERYTYRFRAEQVGTFWYHSHQTAAKQVRRGPVRRARHPAEEDRRQDSRPHGDRAHIPRRSGAQLERPS